MQKPTVQEKQNKTGGKSERTDGQRADNQTNRQKNGRTDRWANEQNEAKNPWIFAPTLMMTFQAVHGE